MPKSSRVGAHSCVVDPEIKRPRSALAVSTLARSGAVSSPKFCSVLGADPGAYRRVQPGWRPELPPAKAGEFGMTDLLAFAVAA